MKVKGSGHMERRGVSLVSGLFESLGFAFREQSENDYGIDGHAELIDSERPTGQLLGIQIKSGPSYFSERSKNSIVFRVDADHVDYWFNHVLPVIVCICDVENHKVYWESVTKRTAIVTGKGYKFDIPLSQILDNTAVPRLRDLLTPLVSSDRYTIFKIEDISHGLAKRYSFKVVINGTLSKAEVASIVRQVTIEGAKRRYYRSHLFEGRWGEADAQVVWTFVYPSAKDEARNNFICRSLWIHDSLDDAARPLPLEGENIGNDIIVDWNENYGFLAQLSSKNTMAKEDYLNVVVPLIHELKLLLDDMGSNLLSLKDGNIEEDGFLDLTSASRKRINEIYWSISGMSLAPFECKEMDQSLQSFIAYMDNVVLYFSDKGLETWTAPNRLEMSLQQRSYALESLGALEYELKKIR